MDPKLKFRNWCFTINNYTVEDVSLMLIQGNNALFMIAGYETCPSTETPHIQGYVEYKNQITLKALKKKFPRAHLSVARGNAEQNQKYCGKDNNYYIVGNPKKQGNRTDIHEIRELIQAGGDMTDVLNECSSYQSAKFGELYLSYLEPKRTSAPTVIWVYGPSGTGKTHTAYELFPEAWISGESLRWWQGYNRHKVAIFDDFRKDFCKFHTLLRILDKYPMTVEVKGGNRQLVADIIIITSCYHPAQMYDTREDIWQLIRRCSAIIWTGDPSLKPVRFNSAQKSGVILDPSFEQKKSPLDWFDDL